MAESMFNDIAQQLFSKTRYLYMSCGAEPFVTAHFDKLLDLVGPYNIPFISYCTNGLLMKQKFIEATLKNRVSEVIFSVDGGTRQTYEGIRIGGSWDVLNRRLADFTQAKKAHAGPVPITRFNFTIQEQNCDEMERFLDWVQQWEPQTVQLRMFRTLEGAIKQKDDDRSAARFLEVIPGLRKTAKKAGIRLLTMDTPQERTSKNNQTKLTQPEVNCQLPWFNLYITPNGEVRPCTIHGPVGNFLKESFQEIENGPEMKALRSSLQDCPKEVCLQCQRTGASGV